LHGAISAVTYFFAEVPNLQPERAAVEQNFSPKGLGPSVPPLPALKDALKETPELIPIAAP
jgi:hypothetical protein